MDIFRVLYRDDLGLCPHRCSQLDTARLRIDSLLWSFRRLGSLVTDRDDSRMTGVTIKVGIKVLECSVGGLRI